MIGAQHLSHIITYFDGVDSALSQRFLRPVPPDETALTSEFCALMDAETQRREESLKFNIDRLNEALEACGDDLHFEFKIDTRPHSSKMENLVSQSDLGLIFDYKNYILPEESYSYLYFLQAKRLYPANGLNEFNERSSFKSIDRRQHENLKILSDKYGEKYFRYMLYCPHTGQYNQLTQTKIRALHTRNLSRPIYDYTQGLTLFDYIKKSAGKIDSGIWLAPIEPSPHSVIALHNRAFADARPLSWFITQLLSEPGSSVGRRPSKNLLEEPSHDELIRKVLSGDRAAIEEFLDDVISGSEDILPTIKILPSSTMTITVTSGGRLPEDFRRAFQG